MLFFIGLFCIRLCEENSGLELAVYGVATISRLLKIIGLFCRISSLLWGSFAKETYDFKEPTSRGHPIGGLVIATETLDASAPSLLT